MDFHGVLQGIVLYLGLPAAVLTGALAFKAGRVGVLIGTIAGSLVALAFTFGDPNTWKGVGVTVAQGIQNVLTWKP